MPTQRFVQKFVSSRFRTKVLAASALLSAWFIPWVLALHTGILIYFPYKPDGKSRYIRFTGPVAGLFGASWTSGSKIPQTCKDALVAAEDNLFYEHWGFEHDTILENYQKLQSGKRVFIGGSTITQQLVKNAFLSRARSILRKAREAAGSLLLTIIMPKTWQLTWYFNVVEFGSRIYGIGAAARHYFKTTPEKLNPRQCTVLVSILPSPVRYEKYLSASTLSDRLRKRYFRIAHRAYIMGLESSAKFYQAKSRDPFGIETQTFPEPFLTEPTFDKMESQSEPPTTEVTLEPTEDLEEQPLYEASMPPEEEADLSEHQQEDPIQLEEAGTQLPIDETLPNFDSD